MNNTVKVVVAVLALGVGAWLIVRSLGGAEDSPDGRHTSFYICSDPECATEFEVKPGESIAPPSSPTEICPTCKKDYPVQAAKCAACGKLTAMDGHGIAIDKCPHCGGGPVEPNG